MEKKLNLGCGHDIRPGYINLDVAELPGVDVVHDVNSLPLPLENDEFSEILCLDVLEHVDLVPVMKDLHRCLKPTGSLKVRVPHFTSRNNFIDPTHKRMFSAFTWDFFVKNNRWARGYYFDFHFGKVAHRHITFEKPGGIAVFFLVEWLVNRSDTTRRIYEATFLASLFPAENVEVTLRK